MEPRNQLDGGSPFFNLNGREAVAAQILRGEFGNIGTQPTLGSHLRAWKRLGYDYGRNKPPQVEFEHIIDNLWEFLRVDDRGNDQFMLRSARTRILEALRTLGYHRRGWRVNTARLNLGGTREAPHSSYDERVNWDDLPFPAPEAPLAEDQAGRIQDDYFAVAQTYVTTPPNTSIRADRFYGDAKNEEQVLWTRYHAYYGFIVLGLPSADRYRFRAIPVPETNSLWHSISYFEAPRTRAGFPNMMKHYEVKACIWAYYTQVLEHPEHVRWRDYVWLHYNDLSGERIPDDATWGPMSILRHLHCNERIHGPITRLYGNPVESPPPGILYVIADYYAVQIVVFQYLPDRGGWINPKSQHHKHTYHTHVFGCAQENPAREQIFLVTRDFTHYDPVHWVGRDQRPATSSGVVWFTPVDQAGGRFKTSWWNSNSNSNSNSNNDDDNNSNNDDDDNNNNNNNDGLQVHLPIPPCEIPHFALPSSPNVDPNAGLWEPSAGSRLTRDVVNLFRYERDIPGGMVSFMPRYDIVQAWNAQLEPARWPDSQRDEVGQIRFPLGTPSITPGEDGEFAAVFSEVPAYDCLFETNAPYQFPLNPEGDVYYQVPP